MAGGGMLCQIRDAHADSTLPASPVTRPKFLWDTSDSGNTPLKADKVTNQKLTRWRTCWLRWTR